MKTEEKVFDIYNNDRPKVLLLGNGINRAFGDKSWGDFMSAIQDTEKYPYNQDRYMLPMGLKASLLSGNKLKEKLRDYTEEHKKVYACNQQELSDLLYDMASMPFDYILTTNYSYELELALSKKDKITDKDLVKSMSYTGRKSPETRYFLHTYNEIMTKRGPRQVWHIHGEYRKPDSLILGQFHYGNLLYKYNEILERNTGTYKRNIKSRQTQKINSWVDAFILGDVYMVGQGMDFAETDLWWLFEKKFVQDNDVAGKTVFYEPMENEELSCIYNHDVECSGKDGYVDEKACKILLMESYDIQRKDLDFTVPDDGSYIDFYNKVIEDLKLSVEV